MISHPLTTTSLEAGAVPPSLAEGSGSRPELLINRPDVNMRFREPYRSYPVKGSHMHSIGAILKNLSVHVKNFGKLIRMSIYGLPIR